MSRSESKPSPSPTTSVRRRAAALAATALGVLVLASAGHAEAGSDDYIGTIGDTTPTGPSGYPGDNSRRFVLREPTKRASDRLLIAGLAVGETADKPLWFKMRYAGPGSAGPTEWLLRAEGNYSPGQIGDVKVGGTVAVVGIDVCTNGPANNPDKHRVKGVKLFVRNFDFDTGKLQGSETEDKYEFANCPKNGWRGRKSCPSGKVAVGFDVHTGEGGAFTGIGLLCSAFGKKDAQLWGGEACKTDGPKCTDGTFCKFTPAEKCGQPYTTGSGAKSGVTLQATGTCTVRRSTSACVHGESPPPNATTPVCGCDGKNYQGSCWAFDAGVSVASVGECPKK